MTMMNDSNVSATIEWLNNPENTADYFNCSHRIMTSFIELLQNDFCKKTKYTRPLISPQGNIFFAIDDTIAREMIFFIGEQLEKIAGFAREEFYFTHKSGHEGSGLQRIRLEFKEGVTRSLLTKITAATGVLQQNSGATT